MLDVDADRTEIRAWLEANCPAGMRTPMPADETPYGGRRAVWVNPESEGWMRAAAARGLTLPTAPESLGGAGFSAEETEVYLDELRRLGGRPPLMGNGVETLAPVLLRYATEVQLAQHLPPIARGEVRWAQGYSEPDAGSDLASLRLSARIDGDHYVVNGQKVWTSFADVADWMFLLARTDPDAAVPQQGMSFLLVDMATPGITVRPITLISGESEFCETFFDEVRIPVENRLGQEGEGWSIAKLQLMYERQSFGERSVMTDHLPLLDALRSAADDEGMREAIVRSELDQIALEATVARLQRLATEGADVSSFANVIKYWQSEHIRRRHDLLTLSMGDEGVDWSTADGAPDGAAAVRDWLFSRAYAIAGGTSEIQLNIIAKRDLKLPAGGPRG